MSDRPETDLDPAVARLLDWRPPPVEPRPRLLRDPARALVVFGAVVAIVSSPLPWMEKVGSPPPQTVTGWTGMFDGFLIAVIAGVLSWTVLNRDAAHSTTALVRWMPPALGATAVLLGVGAIRSMENQAEIWVMYGATGAYQPALAACLGGVAVLGVGALHLGIRLWQEPIGAAGRSQPVFASWGMVASVVSGTVGGVLVVAGAAGLVLGLGVDPDVLSVPLMAGLVLGGFAGAKAGARLSAAIRRIGGGT